MKGLNKYIFITCIILLVTGCKEKVTMLYEDVDALYFYNGTDRTNDYFQKDSVVYTFFFEEESRTSDTIEIIICTTGDVYNYDREIPLVQINESEKFAAVSGRDYISFDDEEMKKILTMPAGKNLVKIPIIALKSSDMTFNEYRLKLSFKDNQYFSTGIDEFSSILIKISNMASKPASWDGSWSSYFGQWGGEKMKFLINYVGFDDFDNPSNYDLSIISFFQISANNKLIEYNKQREKQNLPPLTEADGTIVEFPK